MRGFRRFFRTLFLATLFILFCGGLFGVTASAGNDAAGDGGSLLGAYRAALVVESDGSLTCSVSVTATIYASVIGATEIDVFSSGDGEYFPASSRVRYSHTDYPAMTSSGTAYYQDPIRFSGVAGRYYFALVRVHAGTARGGSTGLYATATVRVPV